MTKPKKKDPVDANNEVNWKTYYASTEIEDEYAFEKCAQIHRYAVDSCKSFFELFGKERKTRGNVKGGQTTHTEQDLLRGMLIFSSAGLDASIKQVIRDNLQDLCEIDLSVKIEFEKFVERKLRGVESGVSINIPLLKSALLSRDPKKYLVEEYVRELTGSSLQSHEEVIKAIKALGLDIKLEPTKLKLLQDSFKYRNQIIHELDFVRDKAKVKQRNRRQRNKSEIIKSVKELLSISKTIITNVHAKSKQKVRSREVDPSLAIITEAKVVAKAAKEPINMVRAV